MNKRKAGRKFSRPKSQREAMLYFLASSLFLKEKIRTTQAKAKELRPLAEKFISKARAGSLASHRYLLKFLPEKIVKKLIEDIAPRYKFRQGGYTRIIKMAPRKSDGAKLAIIELVK